MSLTEKAAGQLVRPAYWAERSLTRLNFHPSGPRAVQLNFGDPDPSINTARFEALHERRQQFEQALGEQPAWDDLAGRKSARVSFTSEFSDVTDVDQWPEMIAWLLDQHVRFRRAIQAAGGLGSLS